ncbi:MAG: NADH-quinone oxidoreductase subunit L [Candidatus Rokuibacteriota bacterium]|nr:MAG: NADH-quinone oxidoreductase subunit L [Candidatus Rokubacteria bacterium]
MSTSVWLIPAFPLAGALVNAIFGRAIGRRAHWVAVPATAAAFVAACVTFSGVVRGATYTGQLYPWIVAGALKAGVSVQVDQLAAVMLLVVTGVGFLIHVYSIGYMQSDPGYARFFSYLNLFVFSMTMLVLASNYLLLYVFWEAVGLCSYLLIGFWYQRPAAAQAGKKAFIVNRVGDFGFGLGVIWLWTVAGTLQYAEVFARAGTLGRATATGIALLLFMGACGKSAQLPLHTWLPDAMEGPTPVSALIHAATMVTAGVYMVARSHALFERSGVALEVVAWVGGVTAIFAATIALVQTDIKRVLAYSTISQLGYMFAAVGVGAYTAGIFHLVTHAFFKALLFLGAGSIIHALGGEQDLRKMGGLAPRMVPTAVTMTIGAAGLAGVPGFAGFFSKDEILAAIYDGGSLGLWSLLLLGAFLTSVYAFRLLFLAFYCAPRMSPEAAHHVHESPTVMTVPLMVLAALTVVTGFAIGIPSGEGTLFAQFLAPVFPPHEVEHGGFGAYALLLLSVIVVAAGFLLAWLLYATRPVAPEDLGRPRTPIHALLFNAYYVDRMYDAVIVRPLFALSVLLARGFDAGVLDGAVNAVGRAVVAWAQGLRRVQTGYVVNYALTMLLGVVALVGFLLSR